MNTLIETTNNWPACLADAALEMFFQSSLLIILILFLDLVLRKKLRADVRYALWLLVPIKLILPPTLAFPTGAAYWLRSPMIAAETLQNPSISGANLQATGNPPMSGTIAGSDASASTAPDASSSFASYCFASYLVVAAGMLTALVVRWFGTYRRLADCLPAPPRLEDAFSETMDRLRLHRKASIRVGEGVGSPCVCGLLNPVVILPVSLSERLTLEQLRAVFAHELTHLKRGDIWVNFGQTILQILYWWHPLVWFANARIRRLREECVDDSVMVFLNHESGIYAPTLLEIAKHSFQRPRLSLGIMESKSFLRQRVERLLEGRAVTRSGLTRKSMILVAACAAVLLPMGRIQSRSTQASPSSAPSTEAVQHESENSPEGSGQSSIIIEAKFIELRNFNPQDEPPDSPLKRLLIGNSTAPSSQEPMAAKSLRSQIAHQENLRLDIVPNLTVVEILAPDRAAKLLARLDRQIGAEVLSTPRVVTSNGRQAQIEILRSITVVTGADVNHPSGRQNQSTDSSMDFVTEEVQIGPVLNVIPRWSENSNEVELIVIASVTEFLGYDDPGKTKLLAATQATGLEGSAQRPRPHFRVREVQAQASVEEGETMLLGGPVTYETQIYKSKIPILGDIPLLGRLFRRESTNKVKKHLIVLVTVRFADGFGESFPRTDNSAKH